MLQKMKSVLIVGPKSDFSRIVDVLYQMGTLHLEDVSGNLPKGSGPVLQMAPADYSDITTLLGTLDGIRALMPSAIDDKTDYQIKYEEIRILPTPGVIRRAFAAVKALEDTTRERAARKSDLAVTITGLSRYEKIIDKIQPLEQQIPILRGFEVTILIIRKEFDDILEIIRPTLSELTHNQFELVAADLDAETIAAITVFNKHYSDDVHRFLFSKNINEVRIPADFANMPLEEALRLIDLRKREAVAESEQITRDLEDLARTWSGELRALRSVLGEREAELRAYHHFAETAYTVMIRGWIPKKFLQKTKDALYDTFLDRVVLVEEAIDPGQAEDAPIFYDNPRWVRPFEFFMQLASPPRYSEIDPTPVMAIFFPFFFGIIVGDIGYGILILLIALFIRFRFPQTAWLRQISGILIISSFPAIFFGFLFGEFFGNFGEMMGWIHPVELFGITWNRLEAMVPLLIVTICVGVVHVVLGLVIGLVNAISRKRKKHICEKCGMLSVIAALLVLVAIFVERLPADLLVPAGILLGVAVILIIYGGGTLGAIEIMSTVGNILSYGRLMAIGMASVILAMIANRLGGAMEILVVGVIIAVLLHLLNLMLAMFSPSIHSVRLHVVEFFSKFYEGGGIPYTPFSTRLNKGGK